MKKPTIRRTGRKLALAGGAISPLFLSVALFAQTAAESTVKSEDTAASDDSDLVILDKFEVTGSHIPYAADAPAIPIKVVTIDQIASTGESADLLEVIRKAAPQFIGNGNLGSTNSNISGGSTNGGSQIKLRNVQTLVLINGRRAAFAPVGATGGYTFVDVNSIPVSAVERIDILSDGASAIYGSDAVSGVVNIILKKNFEGVEVGGNYAFDTASSNWEQKSGRVVVGHTVGKTSFTISAEWLKSDPLYQIDREFSADQTGKTSNFPGVVFDFDSGYSYILNGTTPGLNLDLSGAELVDAGTYSGPYSSVSQYFNLAKYVTLAMGNEKKGATLAYTHELTPNLELFGDVLYSQTSTFYQLAAQPIVGMPLSCEGVYNWYGLGLAEPDQAQNPFDYYVLVRNRFVNHPRKYYSDTDTIRVLNGLKGQINSDWSWEGAVNYNKAVQDYTNENVINREALAEAIDAGAVNLFAVTQDEEALEEYGVLGTATSRNESTLISGDLRVNGSLRDVLPGGPIDVAFGGEYRRETLSATPDAGSYTITDPDSPYYGSAALWDGATTTDPFDVYRYINSAFAEVRIPITGKQQAIRGLHTLELDIAARYDSYSDTDDPLVPKFLLRWLPFSDNFAIRATYSESFSAPELYSLFGPTGVGFTDTLDYLERYDGGVIEDGDQGYLRIPSNSELKPEKSKNWNFGFVYTPKSVKGLSIEANYFNIRQTDVVGSYSSSYILQDVELYGTESRFADRVKIGGFNGTAITAPGQISAAYDELSGSFASVYVTTYAENLGEAKQDGIDWTVEYTFDYEPLGQLDFAVAGYWYHSFTVDGEQYVGTTNGSSVLNGGTVPRWLGSFRGKLTRGKWAVGYNLEYIPSVTDTEGTTEDERHVQDFARLDLWTSYKFEGGSGWRRYVDGLTVRVGVNNVTDEMPPLADASWTDANADVGTYGFLGRVIFVDASYRF